MTSDERKLCQGLLITPPGGRSLISREEFLLRFPSSVEDGRLTVRLLEEAYDEQSNDDLECALLIGFSFGFATKHVEVLCRLVEVDWHLRHEDVVSALDELRAPLAVEALYRATQWVPEYLDFDDSRALAVKAIWALGNLKTSEARAKLEMLAQSKDPILRGNALKQMSR